MPKKAMTLIELLVSIAVLSIVIVIFGSILKSAQQVSSASYALMRSNSRGAAISEIIRADLRRLTQNGFLCIAEDSEGRPRLIFTTAGVSPSALGPEVGSGMIVCYGQANNQGVDPSSANPLDDAIWRQGWVLKRGGTSADVRSAWDLADIQLLDRHDCNAQITDYDLLAPQEHFVNATAIVVPPANPSNLSGLWQCLATNCSGLEISWMDGAGNWYSDINPEADGKFGRPHWDTIGFRADDATQREYSSGGRYRILWTRHDQNVWPKAIRVRFTLDGSPYEVLYSLP